MRTILLYFVLASFSLNLSAQTYRATLKLDSWQPAEQQSGPEIRELAIKWALDNEDDKFSETFNLQWYLGSNFHYQNQKISFADLGATAELLSISSLVIRAKVFSSERHVATLQADMGICPPQGGEWGKEVSYTLAWDRALTTPIKEGLDEKVSYLSADSVKNLFNKGIVLKELEIVEISFGGLYQLEEKAKELAQRHEVDALVAKGDEELKTKNYEAAMKFFEAAQKLDPKSEWVQGRIDNTNYALAMRAAKAAERNKLLEEAVKQYQRASDIFPKRLEPKEAIAAIEEQLRLEVEYDKILKTLEGQYEGEREIALAAHAQEIQFAAKAISEKTEVCRLSLADFHLCSEEFYQSKLNAAQDEARFMVYQDRSAELRARISNNCIKPACDTYESSSASLSASEYLSIAQRKYALFKQTKYREFKVQSEQFLKNCIDADSSLAEAYLFRTHFDKDLVSSFIDIKRALQLAPDLLQAQLLMDSLKTPFYDELYAAIRHGKSQYVKRAIDEGLLLDLEKHKGRSPMTQALAYDQAEVLGILLNDNLEPKGVPRGETSESLQEAIFYAAANDKAASADLLLERGADPEWVDAKDRNILMIVTEERSRNVLGTLLKKRPDLNLEAAVLLSVERGYDGLMEQFLDHGADANLVGGQGDNLLMMAIRLKHKSLIDRLLNKGADVNFANPKGFTPLAYAAMQQRELLITRLLKMNANPEKAIKILVKKRHESVHFLAKILMEYGLENTDIRMVKLSFQSRDSLILEHHSQSEKSFIFHALDNGQVDMAKLMLTAEIDWDQPIDGQSLLIHAIKANESVFVEKLITEKKISLDVRDEQDETPLHLAIRSGNRSLLDLLLNKNHPLNTINIEGQTVLHLALLERNKEVASLLLRMGADPQTEDKRKQRPIHLVVNMSDLDILKQLVEKGADVNVLGESGMRPLHFAAQTGDRAIVEYLLSVGADPKVKDFFKRTPAKIAKKAGFKELSKILK